MLKELLQLNDTTTQDLISNIFKNKFVNYQDVLMTNTSMLISHSNLIENMPSLDFLIKIYIRDQIIVGSTLPGIPAIINGNNNYINWAFTKGRSDVFTYFCAII